MNRFPHVMAVRLGYDPGQVDAFVRRIERTLGLGPLDGPPVTADEIRNARFAVKLGGYNETAVDFALDAFIVAVEARGGQAAAGASDGLVATKDPAGVPEAKRFEDRAPGAGRAGSGGAAGTIAPSAPARATAARATSAHVTAARAAPPPEPGSPSWLEAQAARVERVAFRPGRLGMGYREEEVDAFLDRMVATLRGTAAEPLTAEQVRKATFATVVFRPGYAIGEVDGFLSEMASVLERCP
ncbi:DivIVA domain-containing protein [Microbispora rosea]|uniref:DivIVA domain-containing protein n=1 Tax=Microbispora rosea TaxID=58117 RepID=UPI00379D084A